jgi:DegV family protein with EDD domain
MNKVVIIVDSTCDLPKDIIEQNGIVVVPLTVNFPDVSFYDGVDITTPELYKMVEQRGELPKTAAITLGEIYNVFEKYINLGYDIIYTGISSFMSKSYENAVMMSKEFEEGRIEVVDSLNLSTGIGLVVMKACKWRDEGKNVHEIAELMRETIPYVRSQFVVDTMEYLHKGGRCSSVAKLFGTILKIKPLIVVREGKMSVGGKPRGKIEACLDKLVEMVGEDKDNIDLDAVFVTHSETDSSCQYLSGKVKEVLPEANLLTSRAGCIISTHCGPGTIGVLYILKH